MHVSLSILNTAVLMSHYTSSPLIQKAKIHRFVIQIRNTTSFNGTKVIISTNCRHVGVIECLYIGGLMVCCCQRMTGGGSTLTWWSSLYFGMLDRVDGILNWFDVTYI